MKSIVLLLFMVAAGKACNNKAQLPAPLPIPRGVLPLLSRIPASIVPVAPIAVPPSPIAVPPSPVALPPSPIAVPPSPVALPPSPIAVPPSPVALPPSPAVPSIQSPVTVPLAQPGLVAPSVSIPTIASNASSQAFNSTFSVFSNATQFVNSQTSSVNETLPVVNRIRRALPIAALGAGLVRGVPFAQQAGHKIKEEFNKRIRHRHGRDVRGFQSLRVPSHNVSRPRFNHTKPQAGGNSRPVFRPQVIRGKRSARPRPHSHPVKHQPKPNPRPILRPQVIRGKRAARPRPHSSSSGIKKVGGGIIGALPIIQAAAGSDLAHKAGHKIKQKFDHVKDKIRHRGKRDVGAETTRTKRQAWGFNLGPFGYGFGRPYGYGGGGYGGMGGYGMYGRPYGYGGGFYGAGFGGSPFGIRPWF